VRASVVAGPRLVAPARERVAPGGPLGRVIRRGDDLRAVERAVDRRRQVDRPRNERIERRGHATASVRTTSASSEIPSKPGREVENRPCSGADQRDSIGRSAPKIEPTAAPFVSVSQPPCTAAPIACEKSSNAYSAAAT